MIQEKENKTRVTPVQSEKVINKSYKDDGILGTNVLLFKELDEKNDLINSKRPFSSFKFKKFNEELVINWIYNSNAIEGNTFTLDDTRSILQDDPLIPNNNFKEYLEVINHRDAIAYIYELVKSKAPITENEIRSIHYLLFKGIDDNNAGKYRTENVRIAGANHIPPKYIDVPFEMQKLIYRYRKWNHFHPVVRASYLHGEFVKIHPFIDGNGRTARLLLNLELMKNGYPPVVIKVEKRHDYYEALDTAHTTGDYTDFINIITGLINESEDMYLYLLE